jgi:hypothetical protein
MAASVIRSQAQEAVSARKSKTPLGNPQPCKRIGDGFCRRRGGNQPMKRFSLLVTVFVLSTVLGGCGGSAGNGNQPGQPSAAALSYGDLFSNAAPAAPADDGGFAMPANAAAPVDTFEGRLELGDTSSNGSVAVITDDYGAFYGSTSPWEHLAAFSFEFVQDGSYLIPAQQGLVYTGNLAWNYIAGPGRAWTQSGDSGYTRASFPFALVNRNDNCTHDGVMTFLFSNSKSPNISNVRYQITQETCGGMRFNMWGKIAATYTPNSVANDATIKSNNEAEVANRLPTKPLSALTTDYPNSGVIPANFISAYQSPQYVITYGLFINGVIYSSGCPTRYGEYAYCSEMRLTTYSVSKSMLNGVAMMRLGQLYGPGVYSQLIRDYVPQYTAGGDWSNVTFDNTVDLATGNYLSATYMLDEEKSPQEAAFFDAEDYAPKINDAFVAFPGQVPPGTVWVYHSSDAFIVNQAMNGYLQQQQGSNADIFNMVRQDVFAPLHISLGFDTLRTDNSATGKALGDAGLFVIQDDIAKISKLLNNDSGMVDGNQILDPVRLQETLQRTPTPFGLPEPTTGTPPAMYFNGFHADPVTYSCSFWVPNMAGSGGIIVALFPNGSTFYIVSDNNEWDWTHALSESNKLAPICHP